MRTDWPWRGETRELDDAARKSAGGAYIGLSAGVTHYELAQVGGPRPVALIHGFSVPYFIWDPTYDALRSAGFTPMRYDLYGRGFSDRPYSRYDIDLFVRQLLDLLDGLEIDTTDLLGLSMGGIIAAAFTARHPSRVRKLVLIDPSGAAPLALPLAYRIAILPGIGELILGLMGTETLLKGVASDFYGADQVAEFLERYRIQMAFRGFKRAILSTIRCRMLDDFVGIYRRLALLPTPVMLIWGERDVTVPFRQSRLLRALIPRLMFLPVPMTGHIPHYERPGEVNPALIEFLRS